MASGRPKLPTPPPPKIEMAGAAIDVEKTLRAQHATLQAIYENLIRKEKASGLAGLGADGKVPVAQLPRGENGGVASLTDKGYLEQAHPLLYVEDQKSSGTNGGTFTSGDWRTRDLTTAVVNQITGASLSSNQVTLPAGTYRAWGSAPGFSTGGEIDQHQVRLRDVTNGATLGLGATEVVSFNGSNLQGTSRSWVMCQFTLSGTAAVELQHQCTTTHATFGFGLAGSLGTEVYAQLWIEKVG